MRHLIHPLTRTLSRSEAAQRLGDALGAASLFLLLIVALHLPHLA